MPEPSAELLLIGVLLEAHLATLPRRKRQAYLEKVFELFEKYGDVENVVRLRSRAYDEMLAAKHRSAVAWMRAALATFFVTGSAQ